MRRFQYLLGLIVIISFFVGCNDENPQIASGLFEGEFVRVGKDSIMGKNIYAYTVSDKDAVTGSVSNGLIGVHNDEYNEREGDKGGNFYGTMKAGFALQLRVPTRYKFDDVREKAGFSLDSVALYLAYNQFYFDSLTDQRINIYRLTEPLNSEKYRANDNPPAYDSEPLFSMDFNHEKILDATEVAIDTLKDKNDQDSVVYDTLVSQYLRILVTKDDNPNEIAKLKEIFIDHSDENCYNSQEDFVNYFKGIYAEVESQDKGGIYKFNIGEGLTSGNNNRIYTNLSGFYSYPKEEKDANNEESEEDKETGGFMFYTNDNSTRVNYITHDFTGSKVGEVLSDNENLKKEIKAISNGEKEFPDTEEHKDLYIVGAAGTKTVVLIPEINKFVESLELAEGERIGINKAELVMPTAQDSAYNAENPVPEQLVMIALDEEGEIYTDIKSSTNLFLKATAKYNTDKNAYIFDMSDYLQALVLQKTDSGEYKYKCNGFVLYPTNRREDPRRLWLANEYYDEEEPSAITSGRDKRIKLSITYTIIK